MKILRKGLTGLAVVAAFAAQAAHADQIELKTWWGGHGAANVTLKAGGINYNNGSVLTADRNVNGGAGGFLSYNLTTDPGRTKSFQSWCVDIFHSFSFAVQAPATKQSATNFFDTTLTYAAASRISSDLGKLATKHLADVSTKTTSPTATQSENSVAFQLAVWEIVNENASTNNGLATYNLSNSAAGGFFRVASASPSDSISPNVIGKASAWLAELSTTSSSNYDAYVWGVSNGASGSGMQDVVVFTPVPEPEIYAMLGAGLGLMGFVARRRRQASA